MFTGKRIVQTGLVGMILASSLAVSARTAPSYRALEKIEAAVTAMAKQEQKSRAELQLSWIVLHADTFVTLVTPGHDWIEQTHQGVSQFEISFDQFCFCFII